MTTKWKKNGDEYVIVGPSFDAALFKTDFWRTRVTLKIPTGNIEIFDVYIGQDKAPLDLALDTITERLWSVTTEAARSLCQLHGRRVCTIELKEKKLPKVSKT